MHDRASPRFGSRHFIAAAAGACVANATWWMQPVLLHGLAGPKGLGEAGAGLVVSAEMAAMSLGSALFVRFCNPGRLVVPALAGLVFAVLASLLSLAADGLPALIATRALVGAGVGAALMMSNAVAAGFSDPDKVFGRLGVVNLVFGALLVAAVPFVHRFLAGFAPFVSIMLFLLVAIPAVAVLPGIAPSAQDAARHAAARPEFGGRAKRNILLLTLATLVIGIASGTMWAFYGVIGAGAGLTMAQVDTAISVAILSAIGGAGLAAIIGGRFGRIVPAAAGLALMSVAIMVLSFGPNEAMFRIATCVNVSCLYFVMPFLFGAGSKQDASGRGAAYIGSAFFFTGAISPALGGVLATTIGMQVVGVGVVFAAVLAIGILIHVERHPPVAAVPVPPGHAAIGEPI